MLDLLQPGKFVGPQYRRTGNDPVDLRPLPTLRVWHRRLERAVRINVTEFAPERHDRIEGETIRDQPEPGHRPF